jgi:hypothetical protein
MCGDPIPHWSTPVSGGRVTRRLSSCLGSVLAVGSSGGMHQPYLPSSPSGGCGSSRFGVCGAPPPGTSPSPLAPLGCGGGSYTRPEWTIYSW